MVRRHASPQGQGDQIRQFRLLGKLGEGAFGVVHLALDENLNRKVAIKLPKRSRIATEIEVQAFLIEARMLAGLDHPHIVPAWEYGRAADGRCYVVSPYMGGGNLKDRLSRGRVYPAEAATIALEVALALRHAHSRGLVHRDIKPENVLLDSASRALVADFGLALNAADWAPAALAAGTPAYMSPEQAAGEVQALDGRSDLFSLGIVFYELLTGNRPFEGQRSSEVLDQIQHVEPLPPQARRAGIPDELARICLKCLEKSPEDRFRTAGHLAEALRDWLASLNCSPKANLAAEIPPEFPAEFRAWVSRLRVAAIVAPALLVGLLWPRDASVLDPGQAAHDTNPVPGFAIRDKGLGSIGPWAIHANLFESQLRDWVLRRPGYGAPDRSLIYAHDPHSLSSRPFGVSDCDSPFELRVLDQAGYRSLPGWLPHPRHAPDAFGPHDIIEARFGYPGINSKAHRFCW